MAFRERLLPRLDRLRRIPARFGLRRFRVYVRVTTYAPSAENRVGTSAVVSDVETELLVGGTPPKVVNATSKDLVAGAGEYSAQTFTIGPLTPEFTTGGVDPATITPERGAAPATIQYRITGPGLPAAGLLCKKTDSREDKSFRYMVTVQSIGRRKQ